ncbi:MAG: hypothetical protein JWM87_4778 [Candidatus Eremiobacteraeota bacterium]|nr:hypothetical protein [Candidatus Eremiobacteraeota bacterium]
MPKAIVTPRELDRFADALDEVARVIAYKRSEKTRLVHDAGYVWRDEKYEMFRRVFEQTTAELDTFVRRARAYAAFLRAKSARARKYLDNR